MALVTRNALLHGPSAALATALGIVKLAGAAYLVYLGVQALRASRCTREEPAPAGVRTLGSGHAFRQGLVSNLLNPKIAVPLAVSRGRAVLQRPRVKAALDALSGVVLVALGVRLALERRA